MLIIIAVASIQLTYGQQSEIELIDINFKQYYNNTPLIITTGNTGNNVELNLGVSPSYFWKKNIANINYQNNFSHNSSYAFYQNSPNNTNRPDEYKLVMVKPLEHQPIYNMVGASLLTAGYILQYFQKSN